MVHKLKFMLVTLLAIMFTTVLQAQITTTSSMNGRVIDEEGPIIGAEVIATHIPSGTTYGTVTNEEGRYEISGMRVGGPYDIEVSFIGKRTNRITDITLQLGETYVYEVVLDDTAVDLGEIVVSASKSKFSTEKTGASTNIPNNVLNSMPKISRSITDVTKLSPYAGAGMSIAGSDGRSSNFTVNGANFNNNFGLSANLPGGGNPISLDAIEEIQVVVTPYDVRQTNFIGGGVNAITKSGTNNFHGSAYVYHNNQEMRGNRILDVDFGERPQESRTIYGATLGGPIIKNKLFFFANAEYEKQPGQVVTWRPSDDGVADIANQISRTTKSDMDKVRDFLKSEYGYDAGSYTDYPGDESNVKFLGQLDWNIDNRNKFRVTYNYTKNQSWFPTNGNSTDAGYRNRSMNRISQYGMAFSNSLYSMDNIVNSVSGELNSRFSNRLSNQLMATYTKIKDMRGSPSSPFPFIDILVGRDDNDVPIVEPYISAGYELFTWNNGVNNNILTIMDNVSYYLTNHKITAGASYEYQMANNSYMRNGTGYYRYASVDDFLNKRAPIDVSVTYGYGGEKNPAAEVAFNQIGVYAQDEWSVYDGFKLTLGLRADNITYVDNLIRNNAIYDLDYNGKRVDTGNWPTSKIQLSPRVGFSYDVYGDNSLKIRGGTGVFQGRLPLVFFTNMPTNAGMVQGSGGAVTKYKDGDIDEAETNQDLLNKFEGGMVTDVNKIVEILGLPTDISPEDGELPRDVNGIDPDFKMPQVWKTSLAVDYRIPTSFPFNLTVEGIYNRNINDVMLENWNIQTPNDSWDKFNGSDDRYIYPDMGDITYTSKAAYILTNTDEGWGAIGNVTLTAEPVKDLHLLLAYTRTESKEITGMPGSNAASAYGNTFTINGPALPQLYRSQYVIPNRVIGSVSYKLPWNFGNFNSTTLINIFYTGRNSRHFIGGQNFNYAYSNDMNGDGIDNDLMYIPKGRGDIQFVSQEDEDAFFKFMDQDKYLSNHKGEYAEPYNGVTPWVNLFDLRLARQYHFNVGNQVNTIELSLDILNVGNMIKSTWGVEKYGAATSNNGRLLKYEGVDSENRPTYSFNKNADGEYPTQTFDYNYHFSQTWRLQVGAKYIF